jgi:hypothetical protein
MWSKSGPPTTFHVRIENIAEDTVLRSSTGATARVAIGPTLWVVHTRPAPFFSEGQPDRGEGLEALAEDGDPSRLAAALQGKPGIVSVGTVDLAVGRVSGAAMPTSSYGPLLPGAAYEFTIVAARGDRLSIASMFGQSNDLFYAPREAGIALFTKGEPVRGDVTAHLVLWDAGTEVNEEPGFGPNQAPRQPRPNTGPREHGVVRPVNDGFVYPPITKVLRLTITPRP